MSERETKWLCCSGGCMRPVVGLVMLPREGVAALCVEHGGAKGTPVSHGRLSGEASDE